MNSGVKTTNKRVFIAKSPPKAGLAHEFWSDNQYFGSLRPRTALQEHQASYFLRGTILAWEGTILVWRAQQSFGGARPRNAPRGAGPDSLLPTARYRCNISSKEAVLPGRNDAEKTPPTRYTLRHITASTMQKRLAFCR